MRRLRAAALLALAACGPVSSAAPFTPYAARTQFLLTSPGTAPAGLFGYANPAVLARVEAAESVLAWSTRRRGIGPLSDWGMFSAVPHLAFGLLHRDGAYTEYRLALAAGDLRGGAGLAYGWSTGGGGRAPDPVWVAGLLAQPWPHLSLGATWTATSDGGARELAGDLGLRPFATPRLTLFAELARTGGSARGNFWSAGADLRLYQGLHAAARYLDDRSVGLGLRLELGSVGLWSQARRDRGGRDRSLYALRLGPDRGSALSVWQRRHPAFLQLDLDGPVRHRAYPFFDESRSLLQLLSALRQVEEDPRLGGVALNLSGLQIDAAMAWELRSRLQSLRAAGRRVIVYIDRADIAHYHLASAADRIVLDPAGMVGLQGFAAGQVYLRGALDKLGIGSQEWRYHEYKSAFEPVNRTDMSAADRQQWQALLDDDYARTRADICAARNLAPEAFDHIVNGAAVLMPQEALAQGLVDTLGRWDAVEQWVGDGDEGRLIPAEGHRRAADEGWGEPPAVAVVYALGLCAMDSGIRARQLSAEIDALAEDGSVGAVVLRVDSPGGDALASDVVAGALANCRGAKPVIVSQARLAASGGYWISVESDAIVATPATITGSIGVIGGWLYDRGLKERLGLTTDHVQVGEHADLGLGVPLPLLGVALPDRPLTDAERARTDEVLGSLYGDFVGRVARARQRTPEQIDAVARGRVWSAAAAQEAGLVDTLGGLETALELARARAGMRPDRPLRVIEVPRLGWFPLTDWAGWLGGAGHTAATPEPPWLAWLRFRLERNGQPLLLLPQTYLEQLRPTPP